jgi:hypothetical protein
MSTALLLLATDTPNRLDLLDNALMSIEHQKYPFQEKVLSVDLMDKDAPNSSVQVILDKYEERNWKVVFGRCSGHRGMLNNILRGLSRISGDYLLYSEDDIVVNRIPYDISCIFRESKIGYICYNTHIHDLGIPVGSEPKLAFINNQNNYRVIGNGDLFLIKGLVLKDNYYLNLPVMISKTEIFKKLLEYASSHCQSLGMEPALTKAWFDLGFDKTHDVAVYVKPTTMRDIPHTLDSFYHQANMNFWNNDPSLRHPSINDRANTIL